MTPEEIRFLRAVYTKAERRRRNVRRILVFVGSLGMALYGLGCLYWRWPMEPILGAGIASLSLIAGLQWFDSEQQGGKV